MYYLVPDRIPFELIKQIFNDEQCGDKCPLRYSKEGNYNSDIETQCHACVLQGTKVGSNNNRCSIDIGKYLNRLLEHKVITKAQALELTLDG